MFKGSTLRVGWPRLAVLGLAWTLAPAAAAPRAPAWGVVTHVTDGDSLWLRPVAGGPPRRVRLQGIDAPEICQTHGRQARAALAEKVRGQPVRWQALRRDDYGRTLARVQVNGVDVAQALVREGHAWSARWRRQPGPYAREEAMARRAGIGLFADPAPQRPDAFRRAHGPCARP